MGGGLTSPSPNLSVPEKFFPGSVPKNVSTCRSKCLNKVPDGCSSTSPCQGNSGLGA